MTFKLIVLICCALMLIWMCWQEIKRENRSRLFWRILSSIISVVCLSFLLFPFSYSRNSKEIKNEIIVITAGTEKDSIPRTGYIYVLADAGAELTSLPKATLLPNLNYFLKTHPEINKIKLYGKGLGMDQLEQLGQLEMEFHPTSKPSGIVQVNWPDHLKTNELISVRGSYYNPGSKTVKLNLNAYGKTIDSTLIQAGGTEIFSLQALPKQLGKAVYELIAVQDRDTLSKDPIPFMVGEQSHMKILILASAPDFEYKFLKKWLADHHYPVAFRSLISKNKYSTDFLNMESLNISQVTASNLKNFDVLLLDEELYQSLAEAERSAIKQSVSSGLGLLVRISNPKPSPDLFGNFQRYDVPAIKDKPLNLKFKDGSKLQSLPIDQNLFLRSSAGDQPLLEDLTGKIVVNSRIMASGKILLSTIGATYNWMLSGKTDDYGLYWSSLLSKTARKKNFSQHFFIDSKFPLVQQRSRLVLEQAEDVKVPLIEMDSLSLSARQNMELPFRWDAWFWPERSGWNRISVNHQSEEFFIYQSKDWKSIRDDQMILETSHFIRKGKPIQHQNTAIHTMSSEKVSIWIFLIGFLLSAGFLWAESRMLSNK